MDVRVLEYFLAVAKAGNILSAAKALHLTQPTLSRQLKALEDTLGVTLFNRGSRQIELTDEGVLLRKRAQEILDLVQKTQAEIQIPSSCVAGDIYIGTGETHAMHSIAKVLYEMQQEHLGIRYHLFSGNAEDVYERLDKGLIDFGLVIAPTNISKYASLPLPEKDNWGVLMRKDDPLAKNTVIQPKDIVDKPLIVSKQSMVDEQTASWLGKEYSKLHIVATYNLIYNASILVEAGLGYAVCLDKLCNTSRESNLCFIPLSPPMEAELNFIWKKHQVLSHPSKAFLAKLQQQLAKE